MTKQSEDREKFFTQMERKVFLDMVLCSATERMQVSHVRDLAKGACDIFRDEFEFYGWSMPTKLRDEQS